ncbi:MAG TPA: TerC family protein, partial [Verrucomicrobiota bacterium]|nr:TerC family protein [Verrucomicrobiota bacterium]
MTGPATATQVFSPWHWAVFVGAVVVLLALDLGVFHREARRVRLREALAWTSLFFTLACGFAVWLHFAHERRLALEFFTGYLIELSLSMDNVFVIALIFGYFRVPREFQHRVLFWGILGALVMRGVLILVGAALIREFHWLLYVLGAVLVVTGVRMLFAKEEGVHPEKNPFVRLARRMFPVSGEFEGQRFLTRLDGRRALTPLALVLVMVETTDLVFALDSIPAIFAITRNEFIVFTSNVFAILGLRSLYFALAGAMEYFRYLKVGLSLVLVFIGVKMLLGLWGVVMPIGWALGVVAAILVAAVAGSLIVTLVGRRRPLAPWPRHRGASRR